jgi:soluble lytic murein transglycosylase-like protein
LNRRTKGLIIMVIIAVSVLIYNPVFSVSVGPISEIETKPQEEARDRQDLASRGDSSNRGETSKDALEDEPVWYCSKIPMKKEHQKLLWEQSKKNGVDYMDMLSIIALESNFNEKAISKNGKYRGYFQISTIHGKNLSSTLGTKNDPLNGEVNIIWGTAMYGWILKDKRVITLEGDDKRNVALSIYNRGSGGFDRYGIKESYINKFCQKKEMLLSYFEN